MRYCCLFVLSLLFHCADLLGQHKKIAFSIDDLPLVTYGISDTVYLQRITNKLLSAFEKYNIPAIGFVNEGKLFEGESPIPFQVELLKAWVSRGFTLGNHTYSHVDYNTASFKVFAADVLKGEEVTKVITVKHNLPFRYFRHPYLHTGSLEERSDSLNIFLSQHYYRVAPVTIDNEDYLFAKAYKIADDRRDTDLKKRIGNDYVSYIEMKLHHYEHKTLLLFDRNINQILLLHASLLNADYLDKLAEMFIRNQYEFVSMDEALGDHAYETPITKFGKWGISWIDRWALSQGKKGEFFQGEPETPEYIRALAK